MITCGDLDGKGTACEWLGKDECDTNIIRILPRSGLLSLWGADVACAPVLALLEARAESARWKRAAQKLITQARLGGCPTGEQGEACNWQGPADKCNACWEAWALKEVP